MARGILSKEKTIELNTSFATALARLVVMWSNCDTWLSNVLAVLFRIDVGRAHLIYASFMSSRARADLADRAAIMCLKRPRDVRHLQKLLKDFKAVTRTRNKFCHAQYQVGHGGDTLTHYLNWNYDNFDGANAFDERLLDGNAINEIRQATAKAVSLCGSFERFVKTKPKLVLRLPRNTPLPRLPTRKKR